MQARFLLGPAGSGKTFRCLTEIRDALTAASDGPPLVLLAPKQTTYQLERQLLADPALPGYTRLHILSFERLAFFICDRLGQSPPRMLDEEGRLMVLRSLLQKKRDQLRLFRASARLTGFAQHLSLALRELQRQQLTPESLLKLSDDTRAVEGLSLKLHDLATLLRDYLDWLAARGLQDAEHLLDFAAQILRAPHPPLNLGGVWVDGFTEMSPQELALLAELLPHAPAATVTFCLDRVPAERISWLSHWTVVRRAYHQCHERLARLPNCTITNELLPRRAGHGRFAGNVALGYLEANWAEPKPFTEPAGHLAPSPPLGEKDGMRGIGPGMETEETSALKSRRSPIRIVKCANPDAEVTFAAREILRFVRAGGRFREITVLARNLQDYHAPVVNIFTRFGIPFFLDRRESVSHHPLAELTRNALRTVALSWAHDDWFAALKTGLVPAADADIDRLENEALAHGWKGPAWQKAIAIPNDAEQTRWAEGLRRKIVKPFNQLALRLAQQDNKPNGAQLAAAVREFWQTLKVEDTLNDWTRRESVPQPVHNTVWNQMCAWLDNLELAFPAEALPLRDWLPILEAGLASLTVGVIPPALDQVLIGAIDRSRNPEIRLALVLGLNESVFPAPPEPSVLLNDADRDELEKQGISLSNARQHLGRERFYGYVACTRAREQLMLTLSEADTNGNPLNPSPFLGHLKRLFPSLEIEAYPRARDWRDSEHAGELIVPLLRHQIPGASKTPALSRLNGLPAVTALRERLGHLITPPEVESLSPSLAAPLYGPDLRTSVSRMEQFAACPFKFFVHSGLRAEERKLFELDVRDQGNFQHEVLATFHQQLHEENKRWRDISPPEARERVKAIAASMTVSFRNGLLQASDESRFTARMLTEALQDFVETLVGWMRSQYAFDPAAVEIPFGGEKNAFPPLELDLGQGRRLLLHGRIDRVDLHPDGDGKGALCVVVDYKSSQKQLDSLLMEHGLQLQLPAYLNVLRHWPDPRPVFGVSRLTPVGVFYVNLRGRYERGDTRDEALTDPDSARKAAYRHTGRFDARVLDQLDQRPNATKGDQFNYSRNQDGSISRSSREALDTDAFMAMLDGVEVALKKMGQAIYAGQANVDPYRKGTDTACDQCDYQAICRIDPWTHGFRLLRKPEADDNA